MRWRYFVSALALVLIFAGTAAAQGTQTGTIRGVVTTPDKASVAGVTITISSPALQAERSTTSEADGSFLFLGLPPGAYTVKFAKNSLKSAEKKADVPLGGVAELNTTMELANRAETVNVVGDTPSVLSTPTVGANITQKTVEALPMGRTIVGIASLSPGLTLNTPNSNQVTINGAFAYDNVFLINGVDINDNLFGSPQRLFIEDAIQETQVMTSGISAEYGRFSGGIINAITKSGGNQFSGSFRANLSNPTWSQQTPFDIEHGNLPESKLNRNFEATLGGPIVKDKIWFFGATRVSRLATPATFDITGVSYDTTNNNTRGELKLTMTPVSNHTVTVSYINNNTTFTDATFDFSIDPHTIIDGHEPNSIIGVTWRGLLKGKYFTEAGYSQRQFSFLDEGGTSTDIMNSPFIALSELSHYNAPYFDATDPEDRDNRQLFGNLNWSVSAGGRHDMKVGYEWYRSHHTGGNSQSSTNYVFDADYLTSGGNPVYDADGYLIPVFTPFETLIENWMAVRGATSNTDTHSLFFQDHWAATRRLSFDLGVRFEKVRSEATGNILGVDTQTIVPRLAMAYDFKGDGDWVMHATYGHYAGKYNETLIGGNNNVGNPDVTLGVYVGPAGQGRNFAPGFDPDNYFTVFGRFPTANVTVAAGLSSPVTREFTASLGKQLGRKGAVQVTYVWRNTSNFIDDVIDIENGTTNVVRDGVDIGTFTNIIYTNTNAPERRYQGVILQASYRPQPQWTFGANWTIQIENDGTFEGEATNQPGVPSIFNDYPGIYDPARHTPDGHLSGYQRDKVRIWTIYTWDMHRAGMLSWSGLVRYESPRHYSLVATGVPITSIQQGILDSLGYPDAPSSQSIYFGGRGSEAFHSVTLVDSSLNYDIPVFKRARPFVKFDVFNVFNQNDPVTFNTTVLVDPTSPKDALGLPTGFIRGSNFGKTTSNGNYPAGRTLLMALGFRF